MISEIATYLDSGSVQRFSKSFALAYHALHNHYPITLTIIGTPTNVQWKNVHAIIISDNVPPSSVMPRFPDTKYVSIRYCTSSFRTFLNVLELDMFGARLQKLPMIS